MARLAILALAASMLAPAVAVADLRPMGTLGGPVETDGERWAAWSPRPGVVRVVDTLRGTSFSVQATCPVAGVGGGQILLSCFEQRPGLASYTPWLIDLTTRELRRVDAFDGLLATFGPTPTVRTYPHAVGRHWITVGVQGDKGGYDAHLNWRTGELIDRPTRPRATLVRDLDAPHALRRLCRPLRRRFPARDSELYQYNRPWILRHTAGVDGLELRRCGHRRRVGVARCARFCASPQLGGGLVTWGVASDSRRDAVYAYSVRTRRRVLVGRLPRRVPAPNIHIAHTQTRIYATDGWTGRTYVSRVSRRLR